MPKEILETSPKEIKDGDEYLGCYASGKPFTLHMVWRKLNKEGQQMATGRCVLKSDAKELLALPALQHLRDKGFEVKSNVYAVFVQRPDMRTEVEFSAICKDLSGEYNKSFYRQNFYPQDVHLGIEDRFHKINPQQGRYMKDQQIFDIPEDEKVWLW